MPLDDRAIIAAVGEVLAQERAQRLTLQARVNELTDQLRAPGSEFSDQEFAIRIYEAIGIKAQIGDS
jgi:hypothetical protein